MRKIVFLLSIVVLLMTGCSSMDKYKSQPADQKKAYADKLYQAGKYSKASQLYQQLVFERNSMFTADAQLQLANCYYKMNRFEDARLEYDEMIKQFGDYPHINDAYYYEAACYQEQSLNPNYTQGETQKSIEGYQVFLEKFPFDERKEAALKSIKELQYKLLEKRYINGYIYYKMSDYSSALLYFDGIVELGNHDEIEKKCLYYTTKIYIDRKDWEKAKETKNRLTYYFGDSKEAKKMEKKFSKIGR